MNVRKIIAAIGAILLLGTAGASDCGNLSMTQTIIQIAVSLGLITVGCRGNSARTASRERE